LKATILSFLSRLFNVQNLRPKLHVLERLLPRSQGARRERATRDFDPNTNPSDSKREL